MDDLLHIGPVREPYRLTSMYIGTPVDRVNDRRQPLRPGFRAGFVGDQILADLDQRMGEAVDDGVPEHGVAAQRAVIGLVVADDQRRVLRPACRSAAAATRSSRSHSTPTCQGRTWPCMTGVKECTEKMNGAPPDAAATEAIIAPTAS